MTRPQPPPAAFTTLGDVLDAERRRQGISVNELARRTGQYPGRVHAILRGQTANPGVITVAAILAALGKDWAWFGAATTPAGGQENPAGLAAEKL